MRQIKKLFYNKKYILLVSLCLWNCISRAQHSFVYRISSLYAYDVVEDDKGCLAFTSEAKFARLSPQGQLLFDKYTDVGNLLNMKDSGKYYMAPPGNGFNGSFQIKNYDYYGKLLFDSVKEYPKESNAILDFLDDISRKQIIVAGWRYRNKVGPKFNYWIAGVDYKGKILWQNNIIDTGKSRYFGKILRNIGCGGYLLATKDESSSTYQELMFLDTLGKIINRKPIEPNPYPGSDANGYTLYDLVPNQNGGFVGAVYLTGIGIPTEKWGGYFFVYDSVGTKISQKLVFLRIDDTPIGYIHIEPIADGGLIGSGGNSLTKYNKELNVEWTKRVVSDSLEIIKAAQSRDGGFYGIGIERNNFIGWEQNVVIFKTDSLGNIKKSKINEEKEKPLMLQPNPAQGSVRVAIPYYYGLVQVSIYDVQGRFMWSKIIDNLNYLDISSLTKGVYIVKGRIPETGEVRNMKLVVE